MRAHSSPTYAPINAARQAPPKNPSTGAAFGNHDILAWQFNSTFKPIDNIGGTIPEPMSVALFGIGVVGMVAARRKRKA